MSTGPGSKSEQHELRGAVAWYFRAGSRAGQAQALYDAADNVRRFAGGVEDEKVRAALVDAVAAPMAERAKACELEMGKELSRAKAAKQPSLPQVPGSTAGWRGFGLGVWASATVALFGRALGWW